MKRFFNKRGKKKKKIMKTFCSAQLVVQTSIYTSYAYCFFVLGLANRLRVFNAHSIFKFITWHFGVNWNMLIKIFLFDYGEVISHLWNRPKDTTIFKVTGHKTSHKCQNLLLLNFFDNWPNWVNEFGRNTSLIYFFHFFFVFLNCFRKLLIYNSCGPIIYVNIF